MARMVYYQIDFNGKNFPYQEVHHEAVGCDVLIGSTSFENELVDENGWTIFGKFVDEVADAIADEVVEEYKEAGDCNLQKAVAYAILDKFGKIE